MESVPIKKHKACPPHHAPPVFNIHGDYLTIRSGCHFFSQEYISYVDNKLKEETKNDLINTWEKHLLVNGLQACE